MPITIDDSYSSNVFEYLPKFEKVRFKGVAEAKILRFTALREGEPFNILSVSIVRKDEKLIWDAAVDLIKRSVQEAQGYIKGVYTYELFTFNAGAELNNFNFRELTQLLLNSSRKIEVGRKRPVKYSSCCGFLHRVKEASWAKMDFKSQVEIYAKSAEQFDLLVKKLITQAREYAERTMLVINDLSQRPVYDPDNSEQAQRLEKTLSKELASFDEAPELFACCAQELIELHKNNRRGI